MSDSTWLPRKLNYGWVIVFVAAIAMVATIPGRTHGLGMITERLLADERFHLDRVSYSNINLWATLLGGLFCLPCGWLIDRVGLRITLTTTVAALAATVLWMTRLNDVTSFSVAICLTRGFGQSALSVISITMVGKWFRGGQSWPMAIYTFLLSAGFAFAMDRAKPFAEADWRVLWNAIGYSLVAFIPVAAIFTCDPKPETAQPADADISSTSTQVGFTLFQAMQTQTFWVFGLAISLIALIGAGTSLFSESVLTQQGFPKEAMYDLAITTFMVGMVIKLPVGLIGLWMPLNRILAAGLGLLALCLSLLPMVRTQTGITLYAVGMGVSGAITTVLFFTVWGQAFGKSHLGQIQSIAQMMTVLASALGPRLFAECFERYHTYTGVFQSLAGITAIIAVWSCLIRVPKPSDAPQVQSLSTATDAPLTAFPEASS